MKKHLLLLSPLALLAACSSEPEPAADASAAATPSAEAPTAPAVTPSPTAGANTLTLEGLGDLRIGAAVPAGSTWAERGAQTSDTCRTISSPDYPGVYAIVEGGQVRRITAGERSGVELVEGIGVGASEQDVRGWFPFPATPHKYEAPPAKDLIAPNAASGEPALRFEIGADGKVSLIHVGTMPVLGYVEGCS
jgi:hypothetical protein